MLPKSSTVVFLVVLSALSSLALKRSNDEDDVGQAGKRLLPMPRPKSVNTNSVIVETLDFDERYLVNCSEPGINDFPEGIFTQEQRQNGSSVSNLNSKQSF